MTKAAFTVLGSSAGMPQAGRINSGYVLETDGRLFLLDCGGGVCHMFRRIGFDPLAVERILISHTHPDHISDLPLFIQMEYLAGRRDSLTIHLPYEAVTPVKEIFRAMYLIEEKLPFGMVFSEIRAGRSIESGEATVEPISNTHLAKHTPFVEEHGLENKQQCFSFLIRVGDKSILYSADLGSENDILAYLKGLDVLVIESTHINLEKVLLRAAEDGVGQVVLTHIAEEYDTTKALSLAQESGVAKVQIARDGMTIKL